MSSAGTARGRFGTLTVDATGGTITYSGGYTIHTFTSSGTFTTPGSGNVEYLVVGGGGGGSGSTAGGGGAGGFRTATGFAVTAQAYTITVGAGGAGGASQGAGSNGSDSVFSSITSTGGGKGSGGADGGGFAAGNGGSGGGGSQYSANNPTTQNPGSGTAGQGNNGGSTSAVNGGGAGGGGASAVGGDNTGTGGGVGGAGTASSISGSSVTYAGGGGGASGSGGGGGAGGAGGGGAGGLNAVGTAGTANTGGGGGGGWGYTGGGGGAGGSGIVIVRYLTGTLSGYGTLYLGATNTSSSDLAEYYVAGDQTISAGDVVAIAQNAKLKAQNGEDIETKGVLMKTNTPYDRNLIGIISTNPGVLMGSIDGENKEDKRMLALSGRVPVKIDPESSPIEIGDFLTSSDKPGFARKATRPGYVVARALASWMPGGPDRVEAFLQLTYYMGDIDPTTGQLKTFDTLTVTEEIRGSDMIRGAALIEAGSQSVVVTRNWKRKPASITANASYPTFVYITDLSDRGFTLRVNEPPKKQEELYWQVWW